jgi:hypothetical protein
MCVAENVVILGSLAICNAVMFYAKRQRLCIFLLWQDRNSEISEESIFPTQLMLLIPRGLATVPVLMCM